VRKHFEERVRTITYFDERDDFNVGDYVDVYKVETTKGDSFPRHFFVKREERVYKKENQSY
jgi:hypothetical protein